VKRENFCIMNVDCQSVIIVFVAKAMKGLTG